MHSCRPAAPLVCLVLLLPWQSLKHVESLRSVHQTSDAPTSQHETNKITIENKRTLNVKEEIEGGLEEDAAELDSAAWAAAFGRVMCEDLQLHHIVVVGALRVPRRLVQALQQSLWERAVSTYIITEESVPPAVKWTPTRLRHAKRNSTKSSNSASSARKSQTPSKPDYSNPRPPLKNDKATIFPGNSFSEAGRNASYQNFTPRHSNAPAKEQFHERTEKNLNTTNKFRNYMRTRKKEPVPPAKNSGNVTTFLDDMREDFLERRLVGVPRSNIAILLVGTVKWVTAAAAVRDTLLMYPTDGEVSCQKLCPLLPLGIIVGVFGRNFRSNQNRKAAGGRLQRAVLVPGNRYQLHTVLYWPTDARSRPIRAQHDGTPLLPPASSLEGAPLNVAFVKGHYDAQARVVSPQGDRLTGWLGRLLHHIAQSGDFVIRSVEADEVGFVDSSGSYTGLIGLLERREVQLGLSSLSILADRVRVMDFTTYVQLQKTQFITKAPVVEKDAFALLSIFDLTTWLVLVISAFGGGVALAFLWNATGYQNSESSQLGITKPMMKNHNRRSEDTSIRGSDVSLSKTSSSVGPSTRSDIFPKRTEMKLHPTLRTSQRVRSFDKGSGQTQKLVVLQPGSRNDSGTVFGLPDIWITLQNYSKRNLFQWRNVVLVPKAMLLQSSRRLPKYCAGRIVLLFCWFTGVMVAAVYAGNLKAYLAIPRVSPVPETLDQLRDMGFTVILKDKFKDFNHLWESPNTVLLTLLNRSVELDDSVDPVQYLLGKERLAIIASGVAIPVILNQGANAADGEGPAHSPRAPQRCEMQAAEEDVTYDFSGLGLTKNTYIQNIIDERLRHLRDYGIIEKEFDVSFRPNCRHFRHHTEVSSALSLAEASGVFIVWLGLVKCATLIFAMEICWHKITLYKKKQRNSCGI